MPPCGKLRSTAIWEASTEICYSLLPSPTPTPLSLHSPQNYPSEARASAQVTKFSFDLDLIWLMNLCAAIDTRLIWLYMCILYMHVYTNMFIYLYYIYHICIKRALFGILNLLCCAACKWILNTFPQWIVFFFVVVGFSRFPPLSLPLSFSLVVFANFLSNIAR